MHFNFSHVLLLGVPQPDIVWYKDAIPINPVKTPRYRVLAGGSLQVNGLLPDDTGMFQCFARNQAGEVQTNTYLAVTSEFVFWSVSPDYIFPLSPFFLLILCCTNAFGHFSLTLSSRKAFYATATISPFPFFQDPLSQAAVLLFCQRAGAVINTLL